jgi:hypothetical protein
MANNVEKTGNSHQKVIVMVAGILLVVFVVSFYSFSTFKPKIIKQVQDVKKLASENMSDVPIIEGAEKTSVNKSTDATQTTFHTNKTKEEVQDYYKNIFISNKWLLLSQGSYPDFVVAKYKKADQEITVTAYDTNDDYKTLVSLEITNQ